MLRCRLHHHCHTPGRAPPAPRSLTNHGDPGAVGQHGMLRLPHWCHGRWLRPLGGAVHRVAATVAPRRSAVPGARARLREGWMPQHAINRFWVQPARPRGQPAPMLRSSVRSGS
jgi:hypothetical protein